MSQTKGLQRNTIDKFYTNASAVKQCMKLIKNHIVIDDIDLIIEPSAGNGAFISEIKTITNNFKFFDIDPDHEDIVKQDFLKFDFAPIEQKIHIIGNPPFGRQSSTAIQFIKKCCKVAKSISFILPKSFKKESMRKYFTSLYHLISETDVEPNAFLVNGAKYDVPCVFQIWVKKDVERPRVKKETPKNFEFVKKCNKPDLSFRRVGVNAGIISKDIEMKSEQSHYFIKLVDSNVDDVIKRLEKINFEFNNTVGPKSISKQEMIKEFNKCL